MADDPARPERPDPYRTEFDNRETLFQLRAGQSLVERTGMTWTQALMVCGVQSPEQAHRLAASLQKWRGGRV